MLLAALCVSCITPLDVSTEQPERILVVEGYITTEPGPHTIKLSKTAKYGSVFEGAILNEVGADIWIRDSFGEVTFLTDNQNGRYLTPLGFTAKIGMSYSLHIRTVDGIEYASVQETVLPVPPLDSLSYEFNKLPSSDPISFRSGVDVFATWEDPLDEENYYIWRNNGVYLLETHPELFVTRPGNFPAPKDCCSICYVYEDNGDRAVYIHKDDKTNGLVNTLKVGFIEDDGARYMDKYLVEIEQLSIRKEGFLFFELLRNQLGIDGDIFDPPPATVRGNIINLDDPEANVIGYFHASDVSSASIFIPREVLEETQRPRQVNDDCRLTFGATTISPPNWD